MHFDFEQPIPRSCRANRHYRAHGTRRIGERRWSNWGHGSNGSHRTGRHGWGRSRDRRYGPDRSNGRGNHWRQTGPSGPSGPQGDCR